MHLGFSGGSVVENVPSNAGDTGKKMPYSSILAWKIPRIENSGRLQSVGSQKS